MQLFGTNCTNAYARDVRRVDRDVCALVRGSRERSIALGRSPLLPPRERTQTAAR